MSITEKRDLFGEVRSILAQGPPSQDIFLKVIARIMNAQPLGLTQQVLHQLLPYLEEIFSKWPHEYCNVSVAANGRVHPVFALAKQLTVEPAVGFGQVDVVDFVCKTRAFEQVKHLTVLERFFRQDINNLACSPMGKRLESLDINLCSGVIGWAHPGVASHQDLQDQDSQDQDLPVEDPTHQLESLQVLTVQGGDWLGGHLLSLLEQKATSKLHTLILKGPQPIDGFKPLFANLPPSIKHLTVTDVTSPACYAELWGALDAQDTLPHLQTLTLEGISLEELSVVGLLLNLPVMRRLKELDISQCSLPERIEILRPWVPSPLKVIW